MTSSDPSHSQASTSSSEQQIPVESDASLGEGVREPHSTPAEDGTHMSDASKLGLGRLFGFGKKKKGETKGMESSKEDGNGQGSEPSRHHPSNLKISHSAHPYLQQSPTLVKHDSTSPRVVSPARSQIFERDVQETVSIILPASPAIPSHIQTENHIPAVLDASSEAITDKALNPDSVEIVMHSSHQPAVMTVTGVGSSEATATNWSEDLVAHPDKDDAASNYGALDNTDVRRLSFISFADVVQSEQAEHFNSTRDPIHVAGLTALSSGHRSPSPIRSTDSSQIVGTSPPTSKSASVKGLDLSPCRAGRPMASPTLSFQTPPPQASPSELTIETMSQALRKTRSGDLTGGKSQPMSPTSPVESQECKFP